MKPHRYSLVLEALSPVSHGDTLTGVDNPTNTRLFMRAGRYVRGRSARVPAISENALRSRMVRYPLHDHLLQCLGVGKGELPQAVMNLLYSGGNMAAGSKSPGNEVELGHRVREVYPSLELLGGAVDSFILPRSRLSLVALPVAEEYAGALAQLAPDLAEEAKGVSAFDLIHEETRTRGTGSESEGNQMLYTYETLAAGARVYVELTLEVWASPACRGALALAVEHWDGYFGGQARQGRGRMGVRWLERPEPAPYLEHIEAHAAAMAAGLREGALGTGKVLCQP